MYIPGEHSSSSSHVPIRRSIQVRGQRSAHSLHTMPFGHSSGAETDHNEYHVSDPYANTMECFGDANENVDTNNTDDDRIE